MTQCTRRDFLSYLTSVGAIVGATPAIVAGFDASISTAHAQAIAGGPVPSIKMWVPNWPDIIEIGRLLTQSYSRLGISLEVQSGSMASGLGAIVGEHQVPHMVGMSWGGSPDRLDPDFWLSEFLHSRRAQKGGLNYGGYRNPAYDSVADAQRAEMDVGSREKLVREAQALSSKDNPSLVLLNRTTVQAFNKSRWEGPVAVIGAGIALPYVPWTYVGIKPKVNRKVLRVVAAYDLVTTNPFATPEVHNVAMLRLIYAPLVVRDKHARVVPWAAESVTAIDPVTVEVKLRADLKFHDGRPVTADDLKFTFDLIADKKFPAMARISDSVEGVEVISPSTGRIKLKRPSASFVPNVLGYAFIVPKHIWTNLSGNLADYPNDKPVGYGPFKLREWRKGEYSTLDANKEFFMPPHIDTAIWMVVPNLENQLAMMERGDADIIGSNLDAQQGKRLAASTDIEVVEVPNHGIHEVRLNLALAPLDNPAMRLALQHATDRQQIIDVVFSGKATMATNSFVSPDLKQWGSSSFPNPSFDIAKGREVLQAAGYTWDGSGKLLYPKT